MNWRIFLSNEVLLDIRMKSIILKEKEVDQTNPKYKQDFEKRITGMIYKKIKNSVDPNSKYSISDVVYETVYIPKDIFFKKY